MAEIAYALLGWIIRRVRPSCLETPLQKAPKRGGSPLRDDEQGRHHDDEIRAGVNVEVDIKILGVLLKRNVKAILQ